MKLILVVLALILTGCIAPKLVTFPDLNSKAANGSEFGNRATVYVIGTHMGPGRLQLDGKPAVAIGGNSFIKWAVAPGAHALALNMIGGQGIFDARVSFESGKSYYFVVTGTMLRDGIHFTMEQVSEEQGKSHIAVSRHLPTPDSKFLQSATPDEAVAMLNSPNPYDVSETSRVLYTMNNLNTDHLQQIAVYVEKNMSVTDRLNAESLAWLCKVLSKNNPVGQRAILQNIAAKAADDNVRDYAVKALRAIK